MECLIAQTIVKQIMSLNFWALGAWGVRKRSGFSELDFFGHKFEGGLHIDVSGPKFKGNILIGLNSSDTYTIISYKLSRTKKTEIFSKFEDVFYENLVEIIDSIVG